MSAQATAWESALTSIGNCRELTIHIDESGLIDPAPAAGSTGTQYVMTRVQRQRQLTAIISELRGASGGLARDTRVLAETPDLRVAVLLDADAVNPFLDRLRNATELLEGRSIRVSGPWPPFTFAQQSTEES
jgi:hypothetical protein